MFGIFRVQSDAVRFNVCGRTSKIQSTPNEKSVSRRLLPVLVQPRLGPAMTLDRILAKLKNSLRFLRVAVARNLARTLNMLGRGAFGSRAIRAARDAPIIGSFVRTLLAFYQPFSTLDAAEIYIRRYFSSGHDHPYHSYIHTRFGEMTRESDYPVLYHLAPIASQLRSVFDLGGSVGNLFYAYDRELHLSPHLRWAINDLPHKKQLALDYARLKGENRIGFTDQFSDASGVDLFIVTGALHYFKDKLAAMLGGLDRLPKIVVVNRSPFSKKGDIVTVHDGGQYAVACMLHDIDTFVQGMINLGYELVARWPVHERRTQVPLFPELSDTYWGFCFRLNSVCMVEGT
jgi:putative methyltransferase (TIGR04325 family)